MLRKVVGDASSLIPTRFSHSLPVAHAEPANGGALVSGIEFSGERKHTCCTSRQVAVSDIRMACVL